MSKLDATHTKDELLTEPPVAQVKPIIVSELDRLKAENLNLRLLNLVNRESVLQQQLTEIQNERLLIAQQMGAMRKDMEERYGVNLSTHHIRPGDGLVIPRAPDLAGAADMLKHLRNQLG